MTPPPTYTCAPVARPRRASESQPSSSGAELNSTQLTFFKSPKILRARFRCMMSFKSPSLIRDFYFDISEWHILPARAWTPALMLHLTNPRAKRKVLSLTKPKGKIYETKSLGHYITSDSTISGIFCSTFSPKIIPQTHGIKFVHVPWLPQLHCHSYATSLPITLHIRHLAALFLQVGEAQPPTYSIGTSFYIFYLVYLSQKFWLYLYVIINQKRHNITLFL